MGSPHITYTMRSDVTAQGELNALANVLRYALDCHAKKEAVAENRPDARKENPNASGKPSIPRTS